MTRPAPSIDARQQSPARAVVLGLLGLVLIGLGGVVVFGERWGPIVVSLDRGHGVHAGDLAGVGAALIGVTLLVVSRNVLGAAERRRADRTKRR